jgi:hypothetical protein
MLAILGTWSLSLRKKRRLRVFENSVLRRTFVPNRDEVRREWRKTHTEELNGMYSLPNIVRAIKTRRMRFTGNAARMGARRGVYRGLVGKPLERPRHRWEDNNMMDLQEVG